MKIVVTDTSPVNYLILIGHINLLSRLFDHVFLPTAVQAELSIPIAPVQVRRWIASPPAWIEIVEANELDPNVGLDKGETAAISLAASIQADLLLMDERRGVTVARGKGLRVTGTLGILDLAAEEGLVDFAQAAASLRQTSFRNPADLLETMIKKHTRSHRP
ncbi:MAG: DUF3368 domain-containing protein [Acidobacteria bacterium]|nr:DUF3368 domain-containing protein [Acidobacteriota bacterium]